MKEIINKLFQGCQRLSEKFFPFVRKVLKYSENLPAHYAVALLLLIVFSSILLRLNLPERGGDNARKWSVLHYFHDTGIWYPEQADHHLTRWAFNLPMAWIAGIFDFHPLSYYILPVLFVFLIALLVYFICRLLELPPFISLIIAVIDYCNPVFEQLIGQFDPVLGSVFYVLCASVVILLLLKKNRSPYFWIIPALLFFMAYGSKVTAAYGCVAVVVYLCFFAPDEKAIFSYKKFHLHRGAVIFSCTFFLLFILETLILNHIFQLNYGRFEAITKNHLVYLARHYEPESFIDWLSGFFNFCFDSSNRKYFLILLFLGIFISSYYVIRSRNFIPVWKFIFCMFWIPYLFYCYAVTSIFPFRLVEPHLMRYAKLPWLFGTILCIGVLYAQIRSSSFGRKCCISLFLFSVVFLILIANCIQIRRNFITGNTFFATCKIVKQVEQSKKNHYPVLLAVADKGYWGRVFVAYYGPSSMQKKFWGSSTREILLGKNRKKYYILLNAPNGEQMQEKSFCYILKKEESNSLQLEQLDLSLFSKTTIFVE